MPRAFVGKLLALAGAMIAGVVYIGWMGFSGQTALLAGEGQKTTLRIVPPSAEENSPVLKVRSGSSEEKVLRKEAVLPERKGAQPDGSFPLVSSSQEPHRKPQNLPEEPSGGSLGVSSSSGGRRLILPVIFETKGSSSFQKAERTSAVEASQALPPVKLHVRELPEEAGRVPHQPRPAGYAEVSHEPVLQVVVGEASPGPSTGGAPSSGSGLRGSRGMLAGEVSGKGTLGPPSLHRPPVLRSRQTSKSPTHASESKERDSKQSEQTDSAAGDSKASQADLPNSEAKSPPLSMPVEGSKTAQPDSLASPKARPSDSPQVDQLMRKLHGGATHRSSSAAASGGASSAPVGQGLASQKPSAPTAGAAILGKKEPTGEGLLVSALGKPTSWLGSSGRAPGSLRLPPPPQKVEPAAGPGTAKVPLANRPMSISLSSASSQSGLATASDLLEAIPSGETSPKVGQKPVQKTEREAERARATGAIVMDSDSEGSAISRGQGGSSLFSGPGGVGMPASSSAGWPLVVPSPHCFSDRAAQGGVQPPARIAWLESEGGKTAPSGPTKPVGPSLPTLALPKEGLSPKVSELGPKPAQPVPPASGSAEGGSQAARSAPRGSTGGGASSGGTNGGAPGAQPAISGSSPVDTRPQSAHWHRPTGEVTYLGPFEVRGHVDELKVVVRRSKILRTKVDIYRVSVVDPTICDVVQFTPRELAIIGRSQGATDVTFWFADERYEPITYLVRVIPDPELQQRREEQYGILEDVLAELFPESKVKLIPVADKLIVKGQARDAEEAAQIMAIIRGQMVSPGSREGYGLVQGQAAPPLAQDAQSAGLLPAMQVINMLYIPGVQQVALKVKIAELNRSAIRRFGIDMDLNFVWEDGMLAVRQLLNLASSTAVVSGTFDNENLYFGIHYLQEHGVMRILSEPTLVTLSGRPATFVAGGEFAVPTTVGVAGAAAVTTDFRAFGAIITFLPIVLDKDLIRLEVAPEFSRINEDYSVNGTPGLDTRAVTTTVELREGQTLAIAGLLEDSMNGDNTSNIPLFGQIFGRRNMHRNETELIILVTPELIHPMEPEEVPPLPGFDVTEPTNLEFYLKGRLEGRPTHEYRSTVWPRLRYRYRAGGPATISGPFGHSK